MILDNNNPDHRVMVRRIRDRGIIAIYFYLLMQFASISFNVWWCDGVGQVRAKKWQVMPGKSHRHHLPKRSGGEITAYELLAIK
jgi:hypothetical protein